jgi:hypothetical protein
VDLERGDPRRVALLLVFVAAAAIWGWRQADDANDALGFVAGAGIGLILAALMRWGDGRLARRADFATRTRLAAIALIVGPVVGVAAAGVLLRASGLEELAVLLAGAVGGLIAGVGVLYPME